jgi:hypothetical protein
MSDRNQGLEDAARRLEEEANAADEMYSMRRNLGGAIETDTVVAISVLRGMAAVIRRMKTP